MNKIVEDVLVKFVEELELPEKVVNIEDLPWIPFDEDSCHFKPLRFDFSTGTWIYLFKIKINKTLNRHRHTGGSVLGYNIQGEWRYEGRNWIAKPGTFIFEPPGDIHQLITGNEEVITLFILGGSLQYFDEENRVIGQDDIFTVYKKYFDFCKENNIPFRKDLEY